jgi:hypothetical protein
MRHRLFTIHGVPLVTAMTIVLVMSASPGAQRGRNRGGGNGNQGVPTATNTILAHPDVYYGKQVTISAGVEHMVSKTAFLVDQFHLVGATDVKAIGQPILVIAPYLRRPLDPKRYMLMRGEIVKLDQTAVARVAAEFTLDLEPEVVAKYQGQPVLLTTSVVDSVYAEVASKPLPPPSAAELSMSVAMKTINPLFAALRTATQESKSSLVSEHAARLQPAFTQAETIWDEVGQSAAAQWARDAREHAASIERAASSGNWEAVKTSTGALNQLCQSCHGAYRVRQDDGTFRMTPGAY